jgi:hypothetical protein
MMTGRLIWLVLGLAVGIAHGWGLWRTSRLRRHAATAAVWRIPAVVVLLVGAAVAGRLFPAVGGWAGGLTGAGTWLLLRSGR